MCQLQLQRNLNDRSAYGGQQAQARQRAAPEIVWARQAIQLACELSEVTEDAVIVLRLALELAEGWLAGSDRPEPAKVLTIVRDQA
jgi:hypothetical protein